MHSRIRFAVVAVLLVILLGGCTTLTGKTLEQNIADASITGSVKARLAADKVTSLIRVDVDTVQGIVHLNGVVENAETRERAGELARQVQGVRRVVNNLRIQSG